MDTLTQVVVALKNSEPFNDPAALADIEPYLPELTRIIVQRPQWGDNIVTMQGVYEVTITFLEHMITSGYCQDRIIARAALDNLLTNLREDASDVNDLLERSGLTVDQAFLDDDSDLNDEAKDLYREGKLTYWKLLLICPWVYIPFESAG